MNIAILGGSFDPPHRGHYEAALHVIEQHSIQEVWLMPCRTHPFNKHMSPVMHRFAMVQMMENDMLKVNDYEMLHDGISYSIDTLHALSEQYPHHSFSWIIGSDQVEDFPKWKRWQEIIDDFGLIVVPRGAGSISSTDIRERIRQRKPINRLVTEDVETYIISHKLYL